MGISWEQRPIPEASIKDIDENAVNSFVKKALANQRISENVVHSDTEAILKNLRLINDQGELLLAALLLFGKDSDRYSLSAYYKIGRFGKSHADLRFQDIVKGNILDMADKVMNILDTKYLIRPISYRGLQRIEGLEYPEQALREAILNSIVHKDYSRTNPILSVYDDRLVIWNPGELPETLTVETLKEKHGSEPRNRLIANVFFMAGYIESWGRGIAIMLEGCKEYNIPEPIIAEEQGGLSVTFLKDIYTSEYLKTLNLNERQIKAVLYVKEKGSIKNSEYQEINDLGRTVTAEELQDLTSKKILQRIGTTGRSAKYILIGGMLNAR
jgi:ATP-dependent DNA helicase RecG